MASSGGAFDDFHSVLEAHFLDDRGLFLRSAQSGPIPVCRAYQPEYDLERLPAAPAAPDLRPPKRCRREDALDQVRRPVWPPMLGPIVARRQQFLAILRQALCRVQVLRPPPLPEVAERPIPPPTLLAPPRPRAGRPSPNAASPYAAGTARFGSCASSNAVPASSDRPFSALARKPGGPPTTARPGSNSRPVAPDPAATYASIARFRGTRFPASPPLPLSQPERIASPIPDAPNAHNGYPQFATAPLPVLLRRDLFQVADRARGQAPPRPHQRRMELDALSVTVRLAVTSPRHAQRYATFAQVIPTSPRTHPTLRALR